LQVSFAINGPPVAIIFITYDGSFSPHKKYFTPSSTPEIAIEAPTLASLKASVISSPGTIAGQYRRFLMTAHAKRPTFFNSINARSTQKPESNTTYLPVVKYVDSIRINSPVVRPSSLHRSWIWGG
jgi:hypothetical protein